jgi:hypothetical protein
MVDASPLIFRPKYFSIQMTLRPALDLRARTKRIAWIALAAWYGLEQQTVACRTMTGRRSNVKSGLARDPQAASHIFPGHLLRYVKTAFSIDTSMSSANGRNKSCRWKPFRPEAVHRTM